MKKLLAILMTLVMLLTTCAFAESDTDGAKITLSDIVVYAGEAAMLDLTGLSLGVGVHVGEAGKGMQLTLGALENEVLALNMALAGKQLLLGMTGVTGVYSVDIAATAESMGVDVDAVSNLDVEEVMGKISAEDQMALMSLLMEAMVVVQSGVTTGMTGEIDGVTCDVTTVEVAAESIKPLLEKAVVILDNYSYLLEESGFESFSQMYNEIKPAIGVSGTILESEDSGVIDFVVNGSVMDGAQSGQLKLYAKGEEAADDSVNLYIEIGVGAGEESYALGFNLNVVDENDGSWIPASDAPVDLLTVLEDETQSQQLMLQAMSAAMGAMSQMAAANQTVAALLGSMMAA